MLTAIYPSSDTEYQSDPDRLEAREHIFSHAGGEGDIVPRSSEIYWFSSLISSLARSLTRALST